MLRGVHPCTAELKLHLQILVLITVPKHETVSYHHHPPPLPQTLLQPATSATGLPAITKHSSIFLHHCILIKQELLEGHALSSSHMYHT